MQRALQSLAKVPAPKLGSDASLLQQPLSHSSPCAGEPKGSRNPLRRQRLRFTSEKSPCFNLKCSISPGFLLGFVSPRPYPSTWQQGTGVWLVSVPSLPTAICPDRR